MNHTDRFASAALSLDSPKALPNDATPYAALTPEVVLDALAQLGLYGDGRLTPLGSYENRVYQVGLDEPHPAGHEQLVLKFYRPHRWSAAQIQEEHDFAIELQAAEVPVVAPLAFEGRTLHHWAGFAYSVSPRKGGRRPELDDGEALEWVGRFLARLHTVGERRAFVHRPPLDTAHLAGDSRDWLLANDAIPLDMSKPWERAVTRALSVLEKAAPGLGLASPKNASKNIANISINKSDGCSFYYENDALPLTQADRPTSGLESLRLHGDCHPGNVLWTPTDRPGGGPHFVDLDDARNGPAVQDLWMLLPGGERREQTAALSALLEGYEQFRPFDHRELALIEPLRTLRHIHYAAWLAKRWQDPTFPQHFPWFGSSDYWAGHIHQLEEQTEAMQAPPLQV
jgi:Ser/Thr protein kinase RdoA (MazF antagonist)